MIKERQVSISDCRRPVTSGSVEVSPCIGIVASSQRSLYSLRSIMEEEGYRTVKATDGPGALSLVSANNLDLLLLADPLPEMNYLANTTRQIVTKTREFSSLPIIVVSSNRREGHIAQILEAGASSYFARGEFGDKVLIALVEAVLRRADMAVQKECPILTNGELTVDENQHLVKLGDKEVNLTPNEYRLLALFIGNLDRTLFHDYILSQIWGDGYEGAAHLLVTSIYRLRSKLGENSRKPHFIVTQVGAGYTMPDLNSDR